MNIYIHFRISINRSDQRDQRPQLHQILLFQDRFITYRTIQILDYEYAVSSLSLNRLQSKTENKLKMIPSYMSKH